MNKYQIQNGEQDKKKVICYLLREFYKNGWCSGSGGGISIRENENEVWVAPSGVHKELVEPEDLFLLDLKGNVIQKGISPTLKCSECTPLFLNAYNLRNAGAVLHSHSLNAMIVTKLFSTEFQCTNLEMIKGVAGHKNTDWCRVPIIENTEYENELAGSLKNAILTYPRTFAVLVRNHGVYIWGKTWENAKIHAEIYDYLFSAVVEMHKLKDFIQIPKTLSSDRYVRAWKIDNTREGNEDIRNDLQHKEPQWISPDLLTSLGVLQFIISGNKEDEKLEQICIERQYKNRDEKIVDRRLNNYEDMTKIFATEHLHLDEEIRYTLEGSGYFDVRDKNDEWIRIHVTKGVLIILPEGIYHRYVPDVTNFIHVMRLFKDEPKWTAYNRPEADSLESRAKYLKQFINI